MFSKLVYSEANYVLCCKIGKASGIIGWLKAVYYTWWIRRLTDGEIHREYLALTGKRVNVNE